MNTNWAKILVFSVISLALGVVIGMLLAGRCMDRGHCRGGGCAMEASCHGGGAGCMRGGGAACMHGAGGGACCKGGMMGRDGHHGDMHVKGIVKDLEKADFQGDTTITIEGGTVNVKRTGDKVEVRVEMEKGEGTEEVMEVEKVLEKNDH